MQKVLNDCIVIAKREDGSFVLPPRTSSIYVTLLMEGVDFMSSALTSTVSPHSVSHAIMSTPGPNAWCVFKHDTEQRTLCIKVGVGGDLSPEDAASILRRADTKSYSVMNVTHVMLPRDVEVCGFTHPSTLPHAS